MSTYNIRKEFLGESRAFREQTMFNPALDEPTYLTFKVDFFSEEFNTNLSYLYDTLPQALFSVGLQIGGQGGDSRNILDIWSRQVDLGSVDSFKSSFKSDHLQASGFSQDRPYSALEYLFSRNEDYRCYLLANFLRGWNELQNNYQFYFQEISGLDELFKSSPSRGQKIEKSHVVTIKCLEGIDQKVKALLSLYKAAAWDDHYQRWILPDIFRYFKMDIYISEIRTFHQSSYADPIDPEGRYSKSFLPGLYSSNGSFAKAIDRFAGNIIDKITGKVFSKLDEWTNGGVNINRDQDNLVLGAVKGFVPVTCLRCSMCDFDIDYNPYQSSYSINNDQMETTEIRVRVRQVEEIHNWRIIEPFKNLINANERTIGQSSLAVISRIGQDADQYFNGLLSMADSDKSHSHTDMISSGFIVDAIKDIVKSLTDPSSGILDKGYDIYAAIRGAGAAKDAIAEDYLKFTAANGTISDIGNIKDYSNKRPIQESSAGPQDPYGNLLWDVPDLFDAMDASIHSYIVSLASNLELNGTIEDNYLKYNELYSVGSSDGSIGLTYVPQGASTRDTLIPTALTSVPQKTIVDKILDGTMTYGELYNFFHPRLQTADSSSLATTSKLVADARIQDNHEEAPDLEGQDMTGVRQPEGLSTATDIDHVYDYSEDQQLTMVGIDVSVEKSFATAFGTWYTGELTWIKILDDRSLATDLDNPSTWAEGEFKHMPHVQDTSSMSIATGDGFGDEYDDAMRDAMQQVADSGNDRSLATDLDNSVYWSRGQFYRMQRVEDTSTKSMATIDEFGNVYVESIRNLMQRVEDVSTKSFATVEGFDSNYIDYIKSLMQEVVDPGNDRSIATELDSPIFWARDQFALMQRVEDVSTKSFANSEGFDELYVNTMRESMQEVIDPGNDRSLATDLDNPWWWIIDQRNAMQFNLPGDLDRSLATDLDNEFTWELENRESMLWIPQGDDRSLATHFDNLWDWEIRTRETMEEIAKINDRSLSTSFDNDWHWDEDHQDYMTWMTTDGMDRSLATDLDDPFGSREETFNKVEKMTKMQSVSDRSLATDLDNLASWPPKMEPGFTKPETTDDRSLATDLDAMPPLESVTMNEQSIIAAQMKTPDNKTDEDKRSEMAWLSNETSIFDNIANMQSLTAPEDNMPEQYIQTALVDNSVKQSTILNEDLFTKIAESVSTKSEATSQDSIDFSYDLHSGDRSLATDLDNAPEISADNTKMVDNSTKNPQMIMPNGTINPDTPVRDLIEVYLIDRGKRQEEIQEVTLVSVDDKKTKTIL